MGAPLIETRDDPVVTSERRHPVPSTSPGARAGADRGAILVVAASLAASAVYAVLGVGYVLDDWFALRNAHVGGAWAAAGHEQDLARPGASATYALVFGLLGEHPLLVLALQAAIGALTAWVLLVLLRRFLPAGPATLAALCWVVLPNHTALEVWASATNIALALLLTLVGALVLLSGRRRARPAALVLLMAGALAYEAVAPFGFALVVALPWLERGRPDRRSIAGAAVGYAAVGAWIVVNWHPAKQVARRVPDLGQVVPAHLGWGIAPAGPVADVLALVGLVGVAVALARLRSPHTRGPAELAVLAGVVVIVLGVAPFVKYLYAPLGAGDRFSFVSSIGGALVWSGLITLAWGRRRALGAGLAVVVLSLAWVARLDRARTWTDAGADALAIQAAVRAQVPDPDPDAVVVIGPAPIVRDNVAPYLDRSNIEPALQLAYDDASLRFALTFDLEQFESFPEEQRVDLRPVSRLRPS